MIPWSWYRFTGWWRDTWYILRTTERCQKPVGWSDHCRLKHRHRGNHKPYAH